MDLELLCRWFCALVLEFLDSHQLRQSYAKSTVAMSGLGHTFVKPASRSQYFGFAIVAQWRRGGLLQSNFPVLSGFFHFLPAGNLVSEGAGRDSKLSGGFSLIALETSDS